MHWRPLRPCLTVLSWLALAVATPGVEPPATGDLDSLREQAVKAAALRVSPSVVQIETSGGADVIGSGPRGQQIRKGIGPTTGLIVAADGYIISSAFNFANKPSSIFVTVPGHKERFVTKVVATDHTRLLTLLKIEATHLPVPTAAPKNGIKVGQTTVALGRTLEPNVDRPPSISVGIVSAVGRIWGKAIQTDAKVSPANYGGPLVDIQGRVQGVLVPASPRSDDETAGVEWYDSGIGFAIPLEDVFAVLPRLREGKDLHRGFLGITPKSQDIYGVLPEVGTVSPRSAAAEAGIKPGDVIKEIEGVPVFRQAQVMHLLGSKYEGDTVLVKVQRGKEEIALPKLKLTGALQAVAHPFLGILPMRDDPEAGVEVRYVYPKSPAEDAGLKAGDRITKVGPDGGQLHSFEPGEGSGRDQMLNLMSSLTAGASIKLEVVRKEGKKTETLTLRLGELPEAVPDKLPEPATCKKALQVGKKPAKKDDKDEKDKKDKDDNDKKEGAKKDAAKVETGLFKRTNAAKDHEYWVYVPEDYDPNISNALVVWLHPLNKSKEEDVKLFRDTWEFACADNHFILVAPKAENDTGWVGSETDFIREAVQDVVNGYTIDPRRVVAHGMAVGGQMAFYLGFHARDLIRGVAVTGAPLAGEPKDNQADQPLAFFIVTGGKDPLKEAIADGKAKLAQRKFPVIYHEIPGMGSQYLDEATLDELVRWIDSLDRI